ncbi:hypothetical protein JCM9140_3583 [Halalkalibacter wakoensis JCM 9140]|uniref:Uncharacterized protein n=1 Tax=Halalkalibacter wakoensis JCM 9140 TaxID=1236970 RepID=W4Q5V5_9BACI|nr:hypothetical protein [Halalkalibacter wakoensis]GAE27436.1 hypothetical protein JCM9140_3583 [Halalkalibacter wakoensis JCM 9140]
MVKAILFGILFVFLCVAVPSFVGYYQSSSTSGAQEETEQALSHMVEHEKIESIDERGQIEENEDHQTNEELVYSSRDEAIEAVLEEFSLTELIGIFMDVRNSDEDGHEQLIETLQERFDDDEIEALKVIGFSELEKILQ